MCVDYKACDHAIFPVKLLQKVYSACHSIPYYVCLDVAETAFCH